MSPRGKGSLSPRQAQAQTQPNFSSFLDDLEHIDAEQLELEVEARLAVGSVGFLGRFLLVFSCALLSVTLVYSVGWLVDGFERERVGFCAGPCHCHCHFARQFENKRKALKVSKGEIVACARACALPQGDGGEPGACKPDPTGVGQQLRAYWNATVAEEVETRFNRVGQVFIL